MGREERRAKERLERMRMGKKTVGQIRKETGYSDVNGFMVCLGLVLHRDFGFDDDQIGEILVGMDKLMDPVINGEKKISEYAAELEAETGIKIVSA